MKSLATVFAALIGLAADRPLTRAEAETAFRALFEGDATPSQMGGLLMALRTRGETVDEYAAAAAVMRSKCNAVRAPEGAMDIVGTGGDAKGTLNISTAAAFVTAGAGVVIAKHGNRNLSSKSGAADALGELGINVMVGADIVERALEEVGIGFMMAPMHHPAIAHVMPTSAELGTRTELKNINSFRFVEKAINYEIERQIEVIEGGGRVIQETRLYDPDRDETRSMRGKEQAHDYRYFPDPDLPPLVIDDEFIEAARREMPELPEVKRRRFIEQYGLREADADALVIEPAVADYFEAACAASAADARAVANWVNGEIAAALNRDGTGISAIAVPPTHVGRLLERIADGTISGKIAKDVFAIMWSSGDDPDAIIEARGLKQISDSGEIEAIVDAVLSESAQQVEQYRAGNQKVIGYLVGQVMKRSQGKANPKQVNQVLRERLDG